MKKYLIISLVVIFTSFLVSCTNQPVTTTTVTTVKTTMTEPGSNGFILKKVIKGETVWGYSQETYGTGVEWRQIVAENAFLSQPGRIYYDQARAKWIVLIYPGETIKIGGKYISPTFTSEETTTSTTTTPGTTNYTPLWISLAAIGGILLLALLICCCCGRGCCFFQRRHCGDFDTDMRRAFIQEEREYKNRIIDRMFDHGKLKKFKLNENREFKLSAEYCCSEGKDAKKEN